MSSNLNIMAPQKGLEARYTEDQGSKLNGLTKPPM